MLDLSRVLAGPWCTQNLADMGADVIKIENPARATTRATGARPSSLTRRASPPAMPATSRPATAANAPSPWTRHARGPGADPRAGPAKRRGGGELQDRGAGRYGLDYAGLSALNPRLIYCSVTGFGQTGPYAPRAGYDLLIQAMRSGMMSITGRADGEPGGGPLRVGVAVIDLFTGMYATTAILGALEARHRTGRGQHIDMALLDVAMAMLANQGAGFLNAGNIPKRQGNTHPASCPTRTSHAGRQHAAGHRGNDGQFARFARPRAWTGRATGAFTLNAGRVIHRETLIPMMAELTRTRPTAAWICCWRTRPCPAAPLTIMGQAFDDEQVRARPAHRAGSLPDGQLPAGESINRGQHGQPAAPVRHPLPPRPSALGQPHGRGAGRAPGLDAARLQELRAKGCVVKGVEAFGVQPETTFNAKRSTFNKKRPKPPSLFGVSRSGIHGPRISRACSMRLQATMKVAVRNDTLLSCATCQTPAKASFMMRTQAGVDLVLGPEEAGESCTHSK